MMCQVMDALCIRNIEEATATELLMDGQGAKSHSAIELIDHCSVHLFIKCSHDILPCIVCSLK